MRFRQAMVDFECFPCQSFRSATSFLRRNKTPSAEPGEAIGESCVCGCIARIFCNRGLEGLNGFSETVSAPPIPVITTLQIRFICFRIDGMGLCEVGQVLRRQFDLDLPGDSLSHFGLQRKHAQ